MNVMEIKNKYNIGDKVYITRSYNHNDKLEEVCEFCNSVLKEIPYKRIICDKAVISGIIMYKDRVGYEVETNDIYIGKVVLQISEKEVFDSEEDAKARAVELTKDVKDSILEPHKRRDIKGTVNYF